MDHHEKYRAEIRKIVRKEEQEEYSEARSISHYRSLKPTCLPQWPHRTLQSRELSSIIFKLRSGYCKIGSAQHFLPYEPCPGCGSEDSIEHFLLHCPAYSRQRLRMHSQLPGLGGRSLTVKTLLGRPDNLTSKELKQVALAVAKFVVRTRRKI